MEFQRLRLQRRTKCIGRQLRRAKKFKQGSLADRVFFFQTNGTGRFWRSEGIQTAEKIFAGSEPISASQSGARSGAGPGNATNKPLPSETPPNPRMFPTGFHTLGNGESVCLRRLRAAARGFARNRRLTQSENPSGNDDITYEGFLRLLELRLGLAGVFTFLETIATRTPVMPIGDGLRKLRTDVYSFQLSKGYSHSPPLPSDSHKYFTGLGSLVFEDANDFDLLSAFQRRNRTGGNAEGIKRKFQLFFEIAGPPAESLGFVVAVDDDLVLDSFLAYFVNLRLGHG